MAFDIRTDVSSAAPTFGRAVRLARAVVLLALPLVLLLLESGRCGALANA